MLEEDFNEIILGKVDFSRFSGKTVLFTGANGFLPAYMVETLLNLNDSILEKPCKVIGLVRNEGHSLERFKNYIDNDFFKIVLNDISEYPAISESIDFIIHAASPASPKFYGADPVGVIKPNVLGTMNVLELAKEKQVEGVLYFSSGEVYGVNGGVTILGEESYGVVNPLDIRSCYAESKRMGENLCISYGHQYSVPVKIVRPFHTYGPGMKLDDGRVFADFVKNIVANQDLELKSDGLAVRPFCYLSDAVEAFFLILLEGENNNAYNVANPNEQLSIKALAEELVQLFPEKKLVVKYANTNSDYIPSPIQIQMPSIEKVSKLGWNPSTTIRDGFTKTIRSYL